MFTVMILFRKTQETPNTSRPSPGTPTEVIVHDISIRELHTLQPTGEHRDDKSIGTIACGVWHAGRQHTLMIQRQNCHIAIRRVGDQP